MTQNSYLRSLLVLDETYLENFETRAGRRISLCTPLVVSLPGDLLGGPSGGLGSRGPLGENRVRLGTTVSRGARRPLPARRPASGPGGSGASPRRARPAGTPCDRRRAAAVPGGRGAAGLASPGRAMGAPERRARRGATRIRGPRRAGGRL